MKKHVALIVVACVAACGGDPPAPDPAASAEGVKSIEASLQRPWTLDVQDLQGKPVALLTVRFTQEEAQSCLGGDWLRVEVVGFESLGEPVFPGRDPLSYRVEEGELTIGRNEICDAYLLISGRLSDDFSGEYYAFGKAGRRLLGRVQGRVAPAP